jgi:hypothetical protein
MTIKSKFTTSKRIWNLATSSYSSANYEFKFDDTRTFMAMDDAYNIVAANFGEGTIISTTPNTSAVSGTAKADLDENFNGLENMPNGTIIKFWATSTPVWGANITVSNGQYSLTAPKNQIVNWSTNFNAVKKVAMTDPQSFNTVYVNEDYVYSANGSTSFNDDATTYNITAGNGTSVNPTVTMSGSALVELDDTQSGLENIPNGTNIKIYYPNTNGTTYNVTVQNGKYSITVPKGRTVNLSGTFNAIKKVGGASTNRSFTIASLFTADNTKTVDLSATVN